MKGTPLFRTSTRHPEEGNGRRYAHVLHFGSMCRSAFRCLAGCVKGASFLSLVFLTATSVSIPSDGWTQSRFIDFESFAPQQVLTDQYAGFGVVFSSVPVEQAPTLARSGSRFLEATHGQITINFTVPVRRVTLWVGYRGPYVENLEARLRAFAPHGIVNERSTPLPMPTPSDDVLNLSQAKITHALDVVSDHPPISRAIVLIEPSANGSLLLDDLAFEIATSPQEPVPPVKPKKENPDIWAPPKKGPPKEKLPDLRISTWEPRGPHWIDILVRNDGYLPSSATKVRCASASGSTGTSDLRAIAHGSEERVSIAFQPLSAGVQEVNVLVDPANAVQEMNEGNNDTTIVVSVVPGLKGLRVGEAETRLVNAQLAIGPVSREQNTAQPGTVLSHDPPAGSIVPPQTMVTLVVAFAIPSTRPDLSIRSLDLVESTTGPPSFVARVSNIGREAAPATILLATINRTEVSADVLSLSPRHYGTARIVFPVRQLSPGSIKLNVTVDPQNDIAESNEKNNSLSRPFTIPSYRVIVPDVVGKTLASANEQLAEAGLKAGSVIDTYWGAVRGPVIRHHPPAGSHELVGTEVNVTLGPPPLLLPLVALVFLSAAAIPRVRERFSPHLAAEMRPGPSHLEIAVDDPNAAIELDVRIIPGPHTVELMIPPEDRNKTGETQGDTYER